MRLGPYRDVFDQVCVFNLSVDIYSAWLPLNYCGDDSVAKGGEHQPCRWNLRSGRREGQNVSLSSPSSLHLYLWDRKKVRKTGNHKVSLSSGEASWCPHLEGHTL